jgi:hypothetical protein
MMTGNIQHIYRISWNTLTWQSNANLGGFLVDDRYFYIGYQNTTSFIKINRSTFEVTRSSTISTGMNYYGKMQWYDSRTIAIINYTGIYLYDTYENTWTRLVQYSFSNNSWPGDFCIGKKYILFGYDQTSNPQLLMLYNRDTGNVSTTSLTVTTRPSICYDGTSKFYVVQTGRIYEFDETTGVLGDPTIASVIGNVNACSYTNHAVVVFNYDSTNLTVFNTEQKIYSSVYLPWSLGYTGRSSWYYSGRPYCGIYSGFGINGFYFFMGYTLLTMNYTGSAKYNMGYKFNQYMIFYNAEHEEYLEYDPRFITVDESSVSLHDGNIVFEFGSYSSNHITWAQVDKKQYTRINRVSFE